jgi:hypothetical protein
MFRQIQSRIGSAWCSLTHRSLKWPINGYYQCRSCGRRYPAFAEAQTASRTKRDALQPAVSLLLTLLLIAVAHPLHAAELQQFQPDTLTGWNTYLKNADLHG